MNPGQTGFQLAGSASESYQQFVGLIMAPFVAAVVERARLKAGQAVLDVACGTGFVARAAADVVGDTGRVVGLDINEGMLATARAVPVPGNRQVEWQHASALDMPFHDGEFDAVLCQQGVMFFPDLTKGVTEMTRVTASPGTVVMSFWGPIDASPYMFAYSQRLEPLVPAGSLSTNDVAFGLGRDVVERLLAGLGCSVLESETLERYVLLPSIGEFLPSHLAGLPYGPAYASLDSETKAKFLSDVEGDLAEYRQADGQYSVPFSSHVVSASREGRTP